MADEVKWTAQMRLDLLDLIRKNAHIQDAFADIMANILGDPSYYSGAAADVFKRPHLGWRFTVAQVGAPSLVWTVYRKDANSSAHFYDKDGARIAGSNSALSKSHTLTDTGAIRYLMIRRVATDTTNEARKHYTEAAGKYTASINTETIDDWELQDQATPASTTLVYANAGWVDVASFTTTGAGNSALAAYTAPFWYWDHMAWAGAPPTVDTEPQTLAGVVAGLRQLVQRMRYGGGGSARPWTDDPTYDAAFEEEGGIRLAGGTTLATVLQDAYLRLRGAAFDQVTATVDAESDADDLINIRGRGIIAGGVTNPIVTNDREGHLYSASHVVSAHTSLADVEKWWSADALEFRAGGYQGTGDPWAGLTWPNDWYLSSGPGVAGDDHTAGPDTYDWNVGWSVELNISGGSGTHGGLGPSLFIPINLPHGCMLTDVYVDFYGAAGWPVAVSLELSILQRRWDVQGAGGLVTLMSTNPPTAYNPGAGGGNFTITEAVSPAPSAGNIDNSLYSYYALLTWHCTNAGSGGAWDGIRVTNARFKTLIREASHVY